jgi:hypothetical protein
MSLNRRELLKMSVCAGASALLRSGSLLAQPEPLIQKKISSSGETVPVIGVGTARRYEEITTEAAKAPLRDTLRQFKEAGKSLIPRRPMEPQRRSSASWLMSSTFAVRYSLRPR